MRRSTKKDIALYFGLAYALTWALSFPPTILPTSNPLHAVGGILLHYGPLFAAMIASAVYSDWGAIRLLLRRIFVWRFGVQWCLFILFITILVRALAVAINVYILHQEAPVFFSAPGSVPSGNPLVLLVPVFISIFFQAGIAEEFGWRGFALPRLQKRYSALVASIILGITWAFWHFYPLNWPTLLPIAPYYLILTVSFSIMLTCVFNSTKGSVLATILFHTAANTSDWIIPTTFTAGSSGTNLLILTTAINVAIAIALVTVFGATNLSKRQRITQIDQEDKPIKRKQS